MIVFLLNPIVILSMEFKMSLCDMDVAFLLMVHIDASFIRFESSAPENPDVNCEIESISISFSMGLSFK